MERNVGMMRLIKISQNMKNVLVVLFILMAVMSCDRAAVGPQDQMSQRCGCVEDKKAEKQRYEEIFRSHIMATNITISDSYEKTSKICEELSQISDKQESIRLLDQFLEMAIAQEVTIKEFNRRENWYDKLWFMSFVSFVLVQEKIGYSYEYWDKMFRFFGKYTNEIQKVEQDLPSTHYSKWKESAIDRGVYLGGIKSDLKTWVRVIRDFYYPKLTKDFTEEQKANIMRRFKEVEKYTVTPPYFPGGRN